jgi:hypothetical protein
MITNDLSGNDISNNTITPANEVIISTGDDIFVSICIDRLKKLELLESSLPKLIEQAIVDHKKAKLKMLHEKDKQNPAGVNARVKRYNEKHKDKINARRNMKRNEEKLSKAHQGNSIVESMNLPKPKQGDPPNQKIIVANLVTDKEFTVRF